MSTPPNLTHVCRPLPPPTHTHVPPPPCRFSEVASPYASELLQLQDAAAQQGFLIGQLQQQASELGQAAAAMPTRIARIDR